MSWPKVQISDLGKIGSGTTPKRGTSGYYGGEIPWVKSGELNSDIITDTEEKITQLAMEKHSALKTIPKGSLLVAMYGATVGQVAFLDIEATSNQAVCHIVPNVNIINPRYMFHILKSLKQHWLSRRVGGGQPNISMKIVKETEISLPPLNEQKRIASILDKIGNINRDSDDLELIYSKLIFSKFMDMFVDILENDAYQNRIPLGQLCEKITDGTHHTPTYTESGIPFLRVTDITNSNDSKKYISEAQHLELIRRCHPKKGDILYTKNGTIGVSKIVDWDYDFSIFVSLCLIKPKHEIIDVEYLNTYLNSEYAIRQATRYSKEATIKNLHLVEIRKILVPLPSREMQEEFASFVQEIKRKTEISSHRIQIKLLSQSIKQKLLN